MSGLTTRLNNPAIFSRSFQQRKLDGPVKDPCDFVMKFGGEAFKAIIAAAKHVVDYKFDLLVAEALQADPNAHAHAIEQAVGWFAQYIHARTNLDPDHPALVDPFKRGAIMIRLSKLSGLTVDEVRRIIDWRISRMKQPKLALADEHKFPLQPDPLRGAAIAQLDAISEAGSKAVQS